MFVAHASKTETPLDGVYGICLTTSLPRLRRARVLLGSAASHSNSSHVNRVCGQTRSIPNIHDQETQQTTAAGTRIVARRRATFRARGRRGRGQITPVRHDPRAGPNQRIKTQIASRSSSNSGSSESPDKELMFQSCRKAMPRRGSVKLQRMDKRLRAV
jgi:hypothetical protein